MVEWWRSKQQHQRACTQTFAARYWQQQRVSPSLLPVSMAATDKCNCTTGRTFELPGLAGGAAAGECQPRPAPVGPQQRYAVVQRVQMKASSRWCGTGSASHGSSLPSLPTNNFYCTAARISIGAAAGPRRQLAQAAALSACPPQQPAASRVSRRLPQQHRALHEHAGSAAALRRHCS